VTDGGPAVAAAALPPPPPTAEAVFGDRLPRAVDYATLLATEGVLRGLIGPREVRRLWDRHLLNCAVLGELLPPGARVVDVGSGAGLPGIPVALARPDVEVMLLEPLERRATFLSEATTALGLADRVEVVRGRAEDRAVRRRVAPADWVTARAVAPLDRLVRWCLPLVSADGALLAMKGASVRDEIDRYEREIRSAGGTDIEVRQIGALLGEPTWVAVIRSATLEARKGSR
jgi:16S rRNA (guanine527-N7)-methyltransferase